MRSTTRLRVALFGLAAMRYLALGVAAALVLGHAKPLLGEMMLHDSAYTAIRRTDSVRAFPLAIDDTGGIYTVTGTSTSDSFMAVRNDGSAVTLKGSVGHVVGTAADMEFGFGGDLFTNVGTAVGSYVDGVLRLNPATGEVGMFWQSPPDVAFGDGGMYFDSLNQVMYTMSMSSPDLFALDSSGNATVVVPNVAGGVRGLDQHSSTDLFALGGGGILARIDPVAGTSWQVADLATLIPDAIQFRALAVHPDTDDIWFTIRGELGSSEERRLYRMRSDATELTLIATGSNLLNIATGPSSDGSGQTALYVGAPWGVTSYSHLPDEIFELRVVPEPSTLTMLSLLGALGIIVGWWRRKRCAT